MIAKRESALWKNLKTLLENGDERYIVSRLESYVTPGFPDCVIFHNVTGFFTVELKIVQPNNKIKISPFQIAWNMRHSLLSAPVFILVGGLSKGHVKLFSGPWIEHLRSKTIDQVPGLYEGRLEDLDLRQIVSDSQTPNSKLPTLGD